MMGWERPLMVEHAEAICSSGGDILNVGFGLGIIDIEIQKRGPASHTIIEAHPDVYQHMLDQGWDKKPGDPAAHHELTPQRVLVDLTDQRRGMKLGKRVVCTQSTWNDEICSSCSLLRF